SVYIILNSIMNDNYLAGFPTIISFLGFGFSLTLFGLSVLGEYIQRINLKTTNRPNYLIKTIKKPNK
ncbi:MAG: glycosyltransferase, partial [Bacteroidota bacterium]